MLKRGVLAFLIGSLAAPALGETVRVRLRKGQGRLEFSGLGLGVGLGQRQFVPVGLPKVRKVQIELKRTKERWPVWQVRDVENQTVQRIMAERIFVEGDSLRSGLDPVPHAIELVATESGRIDLVANMDLEKYLTGVLPSEMPASWPVEALKAQVVASRSYALALARERKDAEFDVEATVFDQVFDLRNQVDVGESSQSKINQIVRETSGEVLMDEKGRPVKAHYHADCGGQTELAKNVWGDKFKETGVTQDALCPLSPWAHWQYRISRLDLREALAQHLRLPEGLSLHSVGTVGRTAAGRVVAMDLVFSDGQPRRISSQEFREALGFKNLKSTNFKLYWQGDSVLIEGKGNGHGVGLCQYGARQLAKRGLGYREILSTYYPLVKLGRLPVDLSRKVATSL